MPAPAEFIDTLKPDWRLLIPPVWRELRTYSREKWRADALAAATVAAVSLPQAMGFALLAGLPPQMVIGCVVVGGFVAALFFSSRHLVFGPSNSLSLVLAATFISLRNSTLGPAELAVLLAFLIGACQLAAGLMRFGQVTQFISRSVVIGYSAAIGVLLAFSQLHHLLGVTRLPGESLWTAPAQALEQAVAGQINLWSAGLATAAFLFFTLIRRLRPRWPDALLGLILFSLLDWWLDLGALGIANLGQAHALQATLPDFSGLPLTLHELATLRDLFVPAAAIALLGMLEAASLAKTYSINSGEEVDPNRELVAMGIGNVFSGLFASMPGSASFARSAANFQAGGRTQLSGLLSSIAVLGFVLVLSPLVNHLPVPVLAAALIRVGWNLVNREHIRIAARSTRSDAFALFGTFACAMLLPLDVAIYVGVVLALFLALRKASTPTLVEYVFTDTGQLAERTAAAGRDHPQVAIIHVEGELFFGASDLFQSHIRRQAEREDLRVVILRLKNARHLDATTVFALRALLDWFRLTKRHLLISGVHGDVLRVLKNSGILRHWGEENVFPAELNPNLATKKALQRASELLGDAQPDIRIFYDNPQRLSHPV
jgi:SulP family sulfate permease